MNKFYVTTPIYYVTAKPHLGSLYSTIIADVLARWQQLRGADTFFLTGTDEYGQKIATAAENAGTDPKSFVDGFIDAYKECWQEYGIEYSHFIRTTDTAHVTAVQKWIKKLIKSGEIYKSAYKGWYCTPCETFLNDRAPGAVGDTDGPPCESCNRATGFVAEEAYFFKLSAYQDRLLKFYKEHPEFIYPKERINEVISFVESGLNDLCISRSGISWGVPFPDDDAHVTYVWADALNNYITAIGYLQADKQEMFNKWWPADLQVMGKDIVRFHAIYWPAFLMASDLPLPHHLLVHGWIKMGDQKMSKSLGNVIDPMVLHKIYGADQVRYYLMAQMAINQDSPFTIEGLEQTISADLANEIGNLLNRTLTLALRNECATVPAQQSWSPVSQELQQAAATMIAEVNEHMATCSLHRAIASVKKFVALTNAYFHNQAPWKQAKADKEAFVETIAATCHSLQIIATMYWPIMPQKMSELVAAIGARVDRAVLDQSTWSQEFILKQVPVLFQKIEGKTMAEEKKITEEKKQEATQAVQEKPAEKYIDIKQFVDVELVVGTIEQAEAVEDSDKLVKMSVNCGKRGIRQVLAGVQKYYNPEGLINKQVTIVANLKPRKMMGLDSQGMILFAKDDDGNMRFITPAVPVANGSRLQYWSQDLTVNPEAVQMSNYIDIKQFMELELVVGTIEQAEAFGDSDKLIKVSVNCGDKGVRQILAGIKKFYNPENLINKQAVFLVNLKPRKIMGVESQGMMLFTKDNDGNLRFMTPAAPVTNGAQLQ